MSLQVLYPFQNRQYNRVCQIVNFTGTPAVGVYQSGSVLSATVWEGQNQQTLFNPSVSWYTAGGTQTGYGQGLFSWSCAAQQTIGLSPGGEYYTLVNQTSGGVTTPVWQGRVKVLATEGRTSPAPPDLCTYDFAEAYCSELNLTDTQRDFLPYFVTAASTAIRAYTYRNFDLRTYTKVFDVTLDGTVRLDQVPIQQVLRVQGPKRLVLSVNNTDPNSQYAQVYFTYAGQVDGYGANAQTATGLALVLATGGTVTTTPILFTAGMTIAGAAALVNLVGTGWDAQPYDPYAQWPVSELDGGYVGHACGPNGDPDGYAQFYIWDDLVRGTAWLDNPRRGFLWVGRQNQTSDADIWGPGGSDVFTQTGLTQTGQVKVTFTAGEAAIPMEIQNQCAALVKWKIELAKQELLLKSETGGDYTYALSSEMVAAMPMSVRQALSTWRLHYA